MDEQYVTHIVLRQYRTSSSYSERETAAASHLGIGAIRHLHALGLIEGKEAGGELRYSEEEVIQLRLIRRSCIDRKSTRLNSSHTLISYAPFCFKKKTPTIILHCD